MKKVLSLVLAMIMAIGALHVWAVEEEIEIIYDEQETEPIIFGPMSAVQSTSTATRTNNTNNTNNIRDFNMESNIAGEGRWSYRGVNSLSPFQGNGIDTYMSTSFLSKGTGTNFATDRKSVV